MGEDDIGFGWIRDDSDARVKRQPGGNFGILAELSAEPHAALFVEDGQGHGAKSRSQDHGRFRWTGEWVVPGRVRERIENGAKSLLRVASLVSEARRRDLGTSARSDSHACSRATVKKSTSVL
jgi:hypothetical protein